MKQDINSELAGLFKNDKLLTQALTHKSWVNEHKGVRESNERLEFLGDAVLELIVSEAVYDLFPDKPEGYLTALRASLVNTTHLAQVAVKLKIANMIYLSKGEEATGGRHNKSLLADTVEAIIGALYQAEGLGACKKLIREYLLTDIPHKVKSPLKDAKSRLQELVQNKGFKAPTYKVIKAFGPDHAKTFIVEVLINGEAVSQASGTNKAEASQKAAKTALLRLKAK
ncbi:ribonuclease III [Candidatus Woesebacteria bacterium]|nr:ribonuclease III [Candidatus Woesebacteria bacterium]